MFSDAKLDLTSYINCDVRVQLRNPVETRWRNMAASLQADLSLMQIYIVIICEWNNHNCHLFFQRLYQTEAYMCVLYFITRQ